MGTLPISGRNKQPKWSVVVFFKRDGGVFLTIVEKMLPGFLKPLKQSDEHRTMLTTYFPQ
jgi:hypothetical protein